MNVPFNIERSLNDRLSMNIQLANLTSVMEKTI